MSGVAIVKQQPLLMPMCREVSIACDSGNNYISTKGWLTVSSDGQLWLNPKRRATAEQWARLIAQAMTMLGFGFIRRSEFAIEWELAALIAAMRFCEGLKIGPLPEELQAYPFPEGTHSDADMLFRQLMEEGVPEMLRRWHALYSGGEASCFFWPVRPRTHKVDWKVLLAEGLSNSVSRALEQAGGYEASSTREYKLTPAQKARRQVMTLYPLLGALAANFDIEEDARLCQEYEISVAAIDVGAGKIWINPLARLSPSELIFVFSHELLHAGLNHASRRRGRDPELWNVACDFVINDWLIEMKVGTPPEIGLLYDASLASLSAEEIYDTLAQNIRQARKLITLRGRSGGDILDDTPGSRFVDAEAWCRRALYQGLERCLYTSVRGVLPAGLIEEIRSLAHPPVPWDVRLAEWFDEHFPPPEYRRSYARPSRRQSSTPNIPRPALISPPEELRRARVFGVVLDTSGSMDPALLGKALGAIASYSLAHDVFAVRFICCDAQAYDRGWVQPELLTDRFTLQGRGGTVLQPGVNLLNALAKRGDFPVNGPVLIITDGYCEDKISVAMEHAWLIPQGRRLPFIPTGEVFSLK